jgi:ergothioneine biosynthesis protein EgtB
MAGDYLGVLQSGGGHRVVDDGGMSPHDVHSPQLRSAGKDLLSLALIDARNHTLRWASLFEPMLADLTPAAGIDPPPWLLGHIGWFQEYWIARNVQRQRGLACDATLPHLASLLPQADGCYDDSLVAPAQRWQLALPDLQAAKQYLGETIELTLDLLAAAEETDAGLHFFRLALLYEDLQRETWAEMAQALGAKPSSAPGLLVDPASVAQRAPLLFPASRVQIGSTPGGFVFDNQKWAHDVAVPEFEIDAQAVNWSQYAEFVEDGGYDDARFWSSESWAWLQRESRRVPRHVDQMRGGVLQQRFGRLVRVPLAQPVTHVTWYEADAWCRWAGRRLPTEVEWEAAALAGASRGFRWGDAWEWTATTFRPYAGFSADPPRQRSQRAFGSHKVLRGASFATAGRLRDAKFRRFEEPHRDGLFSGFRSCAA